MTAPSAANVKVLNALPGDAWSDAYLAQAPGHEKLVFRTLKDELAADPARVERFLAGAKALASLRHGAVVTVFDAGKTRDGKVYVLTDHADGDSLAMRGQLALDDLVELGVPLAEALGAAHSLGLVHGALSPARVLLTSKGPRLDFSLAPLLREETADAAGDIRTFVAMLEPFDATLKRKLGAVPDARVLRDRLAGMKSTARTELWEQPPPPPKPTAISPVKTAVVESVQIADPDLTGELIGQYKLEKVIGEGAMGRVYLGRHARIHRQAAIKVLKQEHAQSRELVQRFIQEATAVNAIKNDHIVEVYDFGEEMQSDGTSRVFCVMELLEGISLCDEAWKTPMRIARAVNITQQIARALASAHAAGVLHRDIKPDNIFLLRDDFVKVLDFGVAKLLKQIGDLPKSSTTQGIVIGTPEYMAPEQALGLPIDARSDLYSVGLVLYEMLTGAMPFQADTFAKLVVEITQRNPPPLPQKSRSGELIPRGLVDVVMKCLAKKPEQRFTSAEELAQALEPFSGRAPEPELAPAQSDQDAIAAMKPRPGRALAIAGVVIAVLAGGGYWALRPYETSQPAPAVVVEPPKAPEQIVLEIQSSPTGARVSRADTGEALGVTPFEVKLEKKDAALTLKFELEGRQTLQRAVSLSRNNSLSVDLAAEVAPEPAPVKPPKKRK